LSISVSQAAEMQPGGFTVEVLQSFGIQFLHRVWIEHGASPCLKQRPILLQQRVRQIPGHQSASAGGWVAPISKFKFWFRIKADATGAGGWIRITDGAKA
jgi:hypothetical protein